MVRFLRVLSLLGLLLIGVCVLSVPLALKLPYRANAGAAMMDDFRPFMGEGSDAAPQVRTVTEIGAHIDQFRSTVRRSFGGGEPEAGTMDTLGALAAVERNRANYAAADALPLRALPWLFLVPGALITLLASVQLVLVFTVEREPRPATRAGADAVSPPS